MWLTLHSKTRDTWRESEDVVNRTQTCRSMDVYKPERGKGRKRKNRQANSNDRIYWSLKLYSINFQTAAGKNRQSGLIHGREEHRQYVCHLKCQSCTFTKKADCEHSSTTLSSINAHRNTPHTGHKLIYIPNTHFFCPSGKKKKKKINVALVCARPQQNFLSHLEFEQQAHLTLWKL
jgi:hypothetical protein